MPGHLIDKAIEDKHNGVKSSRDHGMKHFNKVGYAGYESKHIPRWASDTELLNKMIKH